MDFPRVVNQFSNYILVYRCKGADLTSENCYYILINDWNGPDLTMQKQ